MALELSQTNRATVYPEAYHMIDFVHVNKDGSSVATVKIFASKATRLESEENYLEKNPFNYTYDSSSTDNVTTQCYVAMKNQETYKDAKDV